MISLRLRQLLSILVGIAIAAALVYYLAINSHRYLSLLNISAAGLLGILGLSLSIPVINGLINVFMFRCLGVELTLREGFHLAASATLANQLPVPGGLITRGLYLKRKHGLPVSEYLSAAMALFACTTSANGVIGVGILLLAELFDAARHSPLLFVVFLSMAAVSLVFLLPLSRVRLPGRLGTWVENGVRGWMLIRRCRLALLRLIGLQTGFMLIFSLRLWIAFRMLSQSIGFGQATLLACGSMLTQLVSFAPGGLGVREAIVGALATGLGFDLTVSIAAVELDRIPSTLVIVLVGWLSTWVLGRQLFKDPAGRNQRQG